MVQTRLAKRKIEDPDGLASTSLAPSVAQALESSDEEDLVPPKKRPRRQTRKTAKKVVVSKKQRGRKELCQLNLDVLYLIAEYIHPLDLLNLSRTCKSLRTLLMDKSSTFVWKTARDQVESLPNCPSDLTEPEYANLVFCARCHGCGKYAQIIFWKMRRRYCPGCRLERFIPYGSCDEVIRNNDVVACEYFALENEWGAWYDKEQVDALMDEYNKSPEKGKFLQDRAEKYRAIVSHADACEEYHEIRKEDRKNDLDRRRQDRERNIFDRLKKHGFEAEIEHHSARTIRECYPSAFKTSKPLKDKEWNLMLPTWLVGMKNLTERRLESTVYQSRRKVLASEYKRILENPPENLDPSNIIPHVADLANLPTFSAITRAPEGTPHDNYVSAFAQLPNIANEWTEKVVAELRQLVDKELETFSAQGKNVSSNESTPTAAMAPGGLDKLQLACALFRVDTNYASAYTYLDALTRCMCQHEYPQYGQTEAEPATGPIVGRLRITFVNEAPYIVRACGLDPSVATADDMDRRNARLTCLDCKRDTVMTWRSAIFHASVCHRDITPSNRVWQLVSDEHIDAIQAIEGSHSVIDHYNMVNCLLCRRHVGGAREFYAIENHLVDQHQLERDQLKAGVHFLPLDIRFANGVYTAEEVMMIEEEGNVTFKAKEEPAGEADFWHFFL